MPNPKRRSRQRSAGFRLDFNALEDRQLLAANLGNGLQVPNDLPAASNLIVNGDFETFEQGSAPSYTNEFATGRFLPGDQVAGWGVTDGDGNGLSRINLLTFDNARGTILDLDSIQNQDDRVFQDVAVKAGQQYMLAFDYIGPKLIDGADETTNDFEVFWNGEHVASMAGGTFWQRASFVVVGASNDSGDSPGDDTPGEEVTARLEFRDMQDGNRGGDGRGAVIDCVQLSAVTETTVVNGGFEDIGVGAGPGFAPEDVEGWSVFNFSSDVQPRVIQINEFDSGETSIGGDNYLAVNSDLSLTDQVFQDIATDPGRTYYVTFDYRTDPESSAESDQLRVRWNDEWAATFVGTAQWQSVGILLGADSESTRLNFRETGGDSENGAGVHIDNVRLFSVNEIVNDLAVDLNGSSQGSTVSSSYIEGSTPLQIAPALRVDHSSGTRLSSATVFLQGASASTAEALTVDQVEIVGAGLVSDYNQSTGLLTITGDATIEVYQAILRTVGYSNTADRFSAATREIGYRVSDNAIAVGGNTSDLSVATITLISENDPPQLATISDAETNFGEELTFDVDGTDIDGDTLVYSVAVAGLSAAESQPTISANGEFSWTPTEAGEFAVTVTAADPSSVTAERTFMVVVGSLRDIEPASRNGIYPAAPGMSIDTANTYDAVFDTSRGEIRIRLLDDQSPTFVNNFVSLARDGFYDGTVFHRVVATGTESPGDDFVAQGGDPAGTGSGGPGYQIPDETGNTIPFDARGQLAFANSGNNTTGSQFFITIRETGLDSSLFSVFGNVTSGDAVLDDLTRTSQVGPPSFREEPIPGAIPDVVNSITIIETPPEPS